MASLNHIINNDEDLANTRPGSQPAHSASRLSLQSNVAAAKPNLTPSSGPRSASSSSHYNKPDPLNPFMNHPMAKVLSPSPQIDSSSRRRSSASIESMEMSHVQCRTSSLNAAMAPFKSTGTEDTQSRLTPITGRVSKAKKGVRVHHCTDCPKTFSRAEHLRRHQSTHAEPQFPCHVPGCEKMFFRKDLIERHLQRHEQEDKAPKSPKQSTPRRHSRATSQPHGSLSRESGLQMPEAFGGPRISNSVGSSTYPAATSTTWMGTAPNTNLHHAGPSHTGAPAEDYPMDGLAGGGAYVLGQTVPDLQTTSASMLPAYSEPRSVPELSMLCTPEALPSELDWRDTSCMASSASESAFSTPSDNTGHRFTARSPSNDWYNPVTSYQLTASNMPAMSMDNGGFAFPLVYDASPPQGYQPAFSDGMVPLPGYTEANPFVVTTSSCFPSTTVRSISPPMALAQSSETPVAIPSVPSTVRFFGAPGCGSQPPNGSGLLGMGDSVPLALSSDASQAIPAYLEVYWDKVHDAYPIIHKHTYGTASVHNPDHIEVLRCAMAAVATQHIASREDRTRGAQLHAYAWHKSKIFTQSDVWPLPVEQTVLLCEYYARFRGKKKDSHKPTPRFTSLFHRVLENTKSLTSRTLHHKDHSWRTWVKKEAHRRLLAGCFLLDVHSSTYYEQPMCSITGLDYSSPSTLHIPLSASTAQAWEAPSPDAWGEFEPGILTVALNNINLDALSAAEIASMPPFDSAVLLAAYSLSFPRRQRPAQICSSSDEASLQTGPVALANLFPKSAVANTYLALNYTPLHQLLSVPGDNYVLNQKVTRAPEYAEHQRQVDQWRHSGKAAVSVVFAARALKAYLGLGELSDEAETGMKMTKDGGCREWRDISDYWGVYVCALICWAFGQANDEEPREATSRQSAERWITETVNMTPGEAQNIPSRHDARGVVILAGEELAADCLGGRNMLFADAVGVLKMLEGKMQEEATDI